MVIINSPDGYTEKAGHVPLGATISNQPQPALIIQVFVQTKEQLEVEFSRLAPLALEGGMLWITYPKLTSSKKGDIHRDSINEYAQQHGWTGIAIISIDDDWSALRLKRK